MEEFIAVANRLTLDQLRPNFFLGHAGENVDIFLSKFEDWMNATRVAQERWCQQFPLYLQGVSYSWFKSLPQGVQTAANFQEISDVFRTRFHSEDQELLQRMKLYDYVQGEHQSFEDFVNVFNNACVKYNVPEGDRKNMFIKALKPRLKAAVWRQRPDTLQAAIVVARTEEACHQMEHQHDVSVMMQGADTSVHQRQKLVASAEYENDKARYDAQFKAIMQKLDQITGTLRQNDNRPQVQQQQLPRPTRFNRTVDGQPICYDCGRVGHLRSNCRNKKDDRNNRGTKFCQNHGPCGHSTQECRFGPNKPKTEN